MPQFCLASRKCVAFLSGEIWKSFIRGNFRSIISSVCSQQAVQVLFIKVIQPSVHIGRYASLYFCCCVEQNDNELLTLEVIHRYVELLDKYFGNVSAFVWTTKLWMIVLQANNDQLVCIHPIALFVTGVRVGYHIQFWEGLLHSRRAVARRWSARDEQEERSKSYCCAGSVAGG